MRGAWAIVGAGVLAACGSSSGAVDGPGDDAPRADANGDAPDARPDAPFGTPDGFPDAPVTACTTALLYNDCDGALDPNCSTIAEPLRSDDAAAALGLGVLYGGNHDQAAFRNLFDAGGFDVIVFESSSFDVDVATASRLATWVEGGGKIVFSFWDLDGINDSSPPNPSANAAVAATLRTALQISSVATFLTPTSAHDDPASPVSLFNRVETVPSPINFSNAGVDDGDELTPATGFVAARFMNTSGPGAIAVTRGGRAVVLGFLPIELVYQVVRDGDSDGKPDVVELYTNALGYLCGE